MGLAPGVAIANIAFALCLGAALVWRARAARAGEAFLGPFARRSPIHPALGAFVLLSVLSCLFSTLPSRSLEELKGFLTFLLVPLTMGFVRDTEDGHFVLDLYRGTALYMVVRGFLQYLSGARSLDLRISGGLSVYMTYAGLLMTLSIVLAGRGLGPGRSRLSRALDLSIALLGTVAVLLTLTRGAYVGLGVGAVALLAMVRRRWLLALPAVALLAFLAMPTAVRSRALSVDVADPSVRDRLLMWKSGAAMIADRPFFGVGPGRVKELYPVYRLPGHVLTNPGALHSNLVMIAAETGIASALVYLALMAAFFLHAGRLLASGAEESRLALVRGPIAALAALFVAGLSEYNFGDVEVLMATLVVATLPFAADH